MRELRKKYLFKDFRGPSGLVAVMQGDGFVFDTTVCPVKLKEPSGTMTDDEGVTFVQWLDETN